VAFAAAAAAAAAAAVFVTLHAQVIEWEKENRKK
jgi:hypothetical protein